MKKIGFFSSVEFYIIGDQSLARTREKFQPKIPTLSGNIGPSVRPCKQHYNSHFLSKDGGLFK